MRKLLEQHKDTIINFLLAGILLNLVIMLLGSLGVSISSLVRSRDYENYTDSSVLQTVAALPKPEIMTKEEIHWTAGTEVFLGQAFIAKDSEGRELEVRVTHIEDTEGQDMTALYNPLTGGAIFSEPGCYYVTLETMDSQKKVTAEQRPLVIDG